MNPEEARILELAERLSKGDMESALSSELIESGAGNLALHKVPDPEPQPGTE